MGGALVSGDSVDSGNATMATVNSTWNHNKRTGGGGRGPLRATVRPKALGESSQSSGNFQVTQTRHRSLSSSPVSSTYQLSAKSHSLGDLRSGERLPTSPHKEKKRSLHDLVPVPINTERLRPIQQQTRRACVTITADGLVTLVSSKPNKQERMSISGNGLEVSFSCNTNWYLFI